MRVNNNLYLNELKVLQHDDSSSEEYKSLIIDYLIEENSYIDKRIKGLHSGSKNLPSQFYMETLYLRAHAEVSDFRYESKTN